MSDKIYAINDDFFLDIRKELYYDDNNILIYDDTNYNIIEIYIGLCNIITNNIHSINTLDIDTFFNNKNNISVFSNLDIISSFNGYSLKYIELKDENKNYNLYYTFFEKLKPKDFIDLRFDSNNICVDVYEIIKNL